MKIEITKKFQKQVDANKSNSLKKKISDIINSVQRAKSLSEIKNLKKLKVMLTGIESGLEIIGLE